MQKDKFLVWNPAKEMPRVIHHSFEDAKKESERLAQLHPGEQFFVMVPAGYSMVEKPRIFKDSSDWRYVPF